YVPSRFDDGSAQHDDECSGTFVIDRFESYFVSAVLHGMVLGCQPAGQGTRELTFTIDPDAVKKHVGGLRMRITQSRAARLAGDCSVTLQGPWMESSVDPVPQSGDVAFASLSPGAMTLTIRADGFEQICQRVDVVPGVVTDLGTIDLDGART